MQTLKSFLDQSLLIWRDSTAAARFGLALLSIICVAAFIGVGYWSLQPQYVTLANGLEPGKLGQVADALAGADIAYTFKGSSTILVDKRELPRARIATSSLGIQSSNQEMESLPPWGNPDDIFVINQRNKEKQLEQTIQGFEAIESADVLLSIPKPQPFLRRSTAPSASVNLKIMTGAKFGESQAAAIARLVASSVPGLTVDLVAITDRKGNEYSSDKSMGQLSSQEEFRLARERELTQKVEWILLPFLGYGNAAVSVTTEFSFPEGTIKKLEYDSDKSAITDETINSSTTTDNSPSPGGGAAGTGTNVGRGATPANADQLVLTKTEDITNKYIPSMTETVEATKTPTLNSMTVSVVVNKAPEEGALVKEQIQALVQQAVGFRESKDQIAIEFFEFVDPEPVAVPTAFALPWDKINELLKNVSLGVAAIIALLVARKVFMKLQPDSSAPAEVANRATKVNQLSELVKQNPEVFSKIIESWSSDDSDQEPSNSTTNKAA